MAAVNGGLLRRRQRSSSLRDYPEEDGGIEMAEMTRLRDRGSKKDRDRDRSSRSKRRRGERMLHGSNRDEWDDSSEESIDDEEDEDEEVLGPDLDLEIDGDVNGGARWWGDAEAIEVEASDLNVGVGGPEEEDGRGDEDRGDEKGGGREKGATAAVGVAAATTDGVGREEDVSKGLIVGVFELRGRDTVAWRWRRGRKERRPQVSGSPHCSVHPSTGSPRREERTRCGGKDVHGCRDGRRPEWRKPVFGPWLVL